MGTEVENGSGVAAGTARLDKKKDWGAVPVTTKWGRAQTWTDANGRRVASFPVRADANPAQIWAGFGSKRTKNGRRSVCVGVLGPGFDPSGAKRTVSNEMGRRVADALMPGSSEDPSPAPVAAASPAWVPPPMPAEPPW